jgi:hypothetical protein
MITHSGLQWPVGRGGFFTGRVSAEPDARPLN